jgi:peptidoglycan/LPS O-acetylase OafA/YrhL
VVINTGRTYRLNISTKLIGTILAILIALACMFAFYPNYIYVPGINRSSLVAYQSLCRTGWSLAIGWLLFLCCTNQAGIVNTILSWPIWSPLGRLNYSAYLVHATIIYITVFNQTAPTYYQPHVIINKFISNLFFTYVTAIVAHIFFETPFFVLEKKIFKR